ncbi:DUF3575 domain-containing protein [Chryseobacterium sp. Ch-15]|uniref:DUF3575 domain-containing protein n=1 Tax=Chryseobacterium muglaense TaxID=2893752 RepID=A0A9Q3UWB5_9FLAO|nr:DUF3575 domain-containing protein [Chryseobacterium muglaense]MBD3903441.1 DUF3575 domain-containing protein [Chryseobacterium muglaense]MCC9034514.1 DUF3575 domain-containing protein [Chryseobacterium muglaense]MCM2552776.1 DUF3575 domain-containing protein [Chryseobacterium muglaense]
MKKLLLIIPYFIISEATAQEIVNYEPASAAPLDKMNIIKTNVTGYAFRNINLSYERSINRWFAINVGFGTVAEGKVPFMNAFLDDSDEKKFQNIRIKATNFTIEPRFYIGEGYGKGFYFAPYYRYSKVSTNTFDFTFDYNAFENTYPIPLKGLGDANGNSGGLMVGAQFFLNEQHSFVLDFWIAGAHYGSGKGDFTLTSDVILTPEMQAQLKKEIQNLDVPFVDYSVETNANGARIKVDGPWAGFRSGFSLGYRF